MAFPTSAQFLNTVVNENDSACDQLQKISTLSNLIEQVLSEIFNEDGTLKRSFLQQVCDLNCS